MTGHTAPPRGRVSLLGVIVGGLLIGAGGFGLLRVTSANPSADLPPLPPAGPVSEPRLDPIGLPPVLPAAVPVAPVVPGLPALPGSPVLPPVGDPPKPGEVAPPPAPLPTPPPPPSVSQKPMPPVAPPTTPKPADLPPIGELPTPGGLQPPALPPVAPGAMKPAELPAPGPLPAPGGLPLPGGLPEPGSVKPLVTPALPDLPPPAKPVGPLPQTPDLAPLPGAGPATPPIQPANPDFNLRPVPPGNTVNPRPAPGPLTGDGPAPAVTVVPTPVGPLDPPPTPGDPPVTFNLRRTVLAAALGFSLAPNALRAQDDSKPMKPADEPDLKKQVADLKKEVDALRKQNEVQADFILGRADGKEPVTPVDRGLLKRVQTLEEAIKRIEGKLDGLTAGAGSKQVVGASPIGAAGTGTVRLINEYPTDVEIVVNGVSHKLKASELKELSVPAGEFVYELMAAGAAKTTSTIKDTERVTLRIR